MEQYQHFKGVTKKAW
ncbi:hypothetical protein O9992_23110 [Vibrio lentus]|nr:hypothetical protein [Vibrio lentus]